MRRVVGLIAFCSMVLSAGYVSNVEADSEPLNDQEINEIVSGLSSEDLQKLVQTAEKKGKLSAKKNKKNINKKAGKKKKKKNKQKNVLQNSENNMLVNNNASIGGVNNINQNQPISKKKKKRKNKQKNVLQNSENNILVNNNAAIDGVNNINQNQPIKKKKKKRKKTKKNKNVQKNTSQNAAIVINSNKNRSISKNTNNRSDIFANKGRFDRSYQLKKNKKENTADESWKYEVISASDLTNRGELTTINEPVIDGSKIKKSSIVVEKNIKLASNSEKTKAENKVTPTKLSSSNRTIKLASNMKANKVEKKITPLKPLNKEKILAHLDSKKDINFVANLNNSETSIKDKLQQIKNNREAYNLIKTPNKELKDDIQVNKFRVELDHYRKIYALNMKKA